MVRWTTARFAERGLGTPRLDAELLVAHVLALPRLQLYVQFERVLTPEELTALRDMIKRRQAGESIAYLTGRKEFWKFELAVDARVLVPRPDTETLIEEALARLGEPGEAGDRAFAHRRRRHRLGRAGHHAGEGCAPAPPCSPATSRRRRWRWRARTPSGWARRSPSSRGIWARRWPRTRRSR